MGRVTTRVPRTRVDLALGTRTSRPDAVAVEEPLEIRLDGSSVVTTMRTPGDDFDLALGHLVTEGVIAAAEDVVGMMHCLDEDEYGSPTYNVVDVTARPGSTVASARRRTETMSSACGVCGAETIADTRTRVRYAVAQALAHLTPETLMSLPGALAAGQPAFERTGGLHAAGVAGSDGVMLAVREDVGRHNAVDKAIGALVRSQPLPLAGTVLVVSARASFEIVQKAAVAGIPVVVAVGAPTSLAVSLAAEVGITLVAFTRPPSASIYTHPERIT